MKQRENPRKAGWKRGARYCRGTLQPAAAILGKRGEAKRGGGERTTREKSEEKPVPVARPMNKI